jgi:hypothetical protein
MTARQLIIRLLFPGIAALLFIAALGTYLALRTPPAQTLPPGQQFGEDVSLRGEITCLPHRDKNGPQTEECAIGLKSEGVFYGLQNMDMESLMNGSLGTGKKVDVSGRLLRPNTNDTYDIVGSVDVSRAIPLP